MRSMRSMRWDFFDDSYMHAYKHTYTLLYHPLREGPGRSVYECMYVYMYVCVYAYEYICMYVYVCTHTYMHVHKHINICIRKNTYVQTGEQSAALPS